jgi:xanthine dehydrogenase YagR molybdenum-binding subunit
MNRADIDRRDAEAKVTGRAVYAADVPVRDELHAALVTSSAAGRVRAIDTSAAAAMPGVVGVMTHLDAPRLHPGDPQPLLQDTAVLHAGQPVALVAAATLGQARRAARLVQVDLEAANPGPDFDAAAPFAPGQVLGQAPDSVRGDPDRALARADLVRVDALYSTPTHVHAPMEPHAAWVAWDGDRVEVRTSTSGIFAARRVIAHAFALPVDHVRVLCEAQGGGFGSKGSAWWPCLLLAVAAARRFGRPLRLVLTREQMFAAVGNRARTRQRVSIAAERDGRLVGLRHEVVAETGMVRDYSDSTCFASRSVYACPNAAVRHRLVRTRTPQAVAMRGPGEAPGSFALECALDELAERLAIDPVELRLRIAAERDEHTGLAWSSNSLRECLRAGADAFGWAGRGPVGSMRDGRLRIGWGVATSTYPGFRAAAAARIRVERGGAIRVECGSQEVGNGAITVMAQVAADGLGVPVDAVEVRHGDTLLPEAPMAAGAMSTASVVPAIEAAARALRDKVIALAAADPRSPLDSIAALLERAGLDAVEAGARTAGDPIDRSVNTFGACFAEVRIDETLAELRVTRLTAAYAAGRIINPKLARSQLAGGVVFGLGMALHEKLDFDPATGLVANASLMDYLVPVHADVPAIEVLLVDERDAHVPGGVKGVGMNGAVGTAAAIANAVHHALGVRVRELPIRPESLL